MFTKSSMKYQFETLLQSAKVATLGPINLGSPQTKNKTQHNNITLLEILK